MAQLEQVPVAHRAAPQAQVIVHPKGLWQSPDWLWVLRMVPPGLALPGVQVNGMGMITQLERELENPPAEAAVRISPLLRSGYFIILCAVEVDAVACPQSSDEEDPTRSFQNCLPMTLNGVKSIPARKKGIQKKQNQRVLLKGVMARTLALLTEPFSQLLVVHLSNNLCPRQRIGTG
ncbi:hypothetical protein WISP_146101 [Willisornis vidua]|uniref:Uncharacterized protein n=1 Tax=Willisornis vidua TaxID=1566151 RepID=A0ABQ9CKT5_9PASS|nr:hypothetical protein WISP_146101 [Willisornis vidua]